MEKKMAVSIMEPKSEPSRGGRYQAVLARRREKIEMSSICPVMKAAADAVAMRWVVAAAPSAFHGSGLKLS